jgi:Taurine catabolism dioxygenase TauD, TfdA family
MSISLHESNISMPPDANERLWAAAEDEVRSIGRETLALASFDDVRAVAEAAGRLATTLPDSVMESARSFAETGNEQGFIVVSGVEPPEELTQTFPKDRKLPTTVAAGAGKLVAVTLSATVGPPITYSDNPAGPEAFIRLVAPEPAFGSTRSTANAIDTGWHCEVASTLRPRAFGLYCVRPQAGVTTQVISPNRLIERLDDNDRGLLGQSRFATPAGFSASELPAPSPVIAETEYGTMLIYDSDWTQPCDPADQEASSVLDRLAGLLGDPSLWDEHEINTGEELFIDNFGLHRRGGFTPDYNYPRMLFRVFIGGEWHRDSAPVASLT